MSKDNLMIEATARDFDVELIANNEQFYLYSALRPGGRQRVATSQGPWISHVCGVWHFVLLEIQSPNMTRVEQIHIPRFKMASALQLQDLFFTSKTYSKPEDATWMPFSARIHGHNKLSYVVNRSVDLMLKESFVDDLKKDLLILEEAKGRVREKDEGLYFLPRVKTVAGHLVEDSSEAVIEAIAFERLCTKRLTAENFGIYSAFCTYRDFETSVSMPPELIRELVDGQFQYDPDGVSEEVLDLFERVQKKLFSEPIWGKGIKMSTENAASILSETMRKLTRYQRVQFILMNGMHAAGVFLPLAAITEECSFEQYAWYMCQGLQPDSPEEQERRTETAYIQFYGELAGSDH